MEDDPNTKFEGRTLRIAFHIKITPPEGQKVGHTDQAQEVSRRMIHRLIGYLLTFEEVRGCRIDLDIDRLII